MEQKGFSYEKWEKLNDFSYYKKAIKKGKLDSTSKLENILLHKQFFSVPWLICYKELLT